MAAWKKKELKSAENKMFGEKLIYWREKKKKKIRAKRRRNALYLAFFLDHEKEI